ncbi:MAG: undecaprenyl/decaprenyl-phosphate alpha-N-acetylglucosaminyl 1-phosphate transferase [Phycisphaeraceae bacterium]|nr:MAG: undecaprenyl/decaprenyl-phosphate alpha-N-acetylglucosaminyl 1-phosphate transferase [Phycisphaeraceae bacterium]
MIPDFPASLDQVTTQGLAPEVVSRVADLGRQIEQMAADQARLADLVGLDSASRTQSWIEVFNGYVGVLVIAFLVTLIATPIMRRLALANGVIDHPSDPRKVHRVPIAYLGGVAVYLGIMAGIFTSYVGINHPSLISFHDSLPETPFGVLDYRMVPPWILLGLTIIMVIGLIDDVTGISPRVKIGGQLLAAAALAYGDIGVKVAQGVLMPTLGKLLHNPDLFYSIPLGFDVPLIGSAINVDIIYWTGTAVIAVFVLGACNASNLIDGLDGLLSGVTGIATVGLLAIALLMAFTHPGPRDAQRIILCMAVLGACLGFLPHNFNPATIFLGDCGSLLLGYSTIVIILTLGDTGRTDFVIAGLIVYAIPILDTVLAIVRRKMEGKSMSDPDSDHLHHMLKRSFGVKGAVFIMYGMGAAFAVIGVVLAASGAKFVYSLALLCASFIVVYSMKIARRKQLEQQAMERAMPAPAPAERASEPESATV